MLRSTRSRVVVAALGALTLVAAPAQTASAGGGHGHGGAPVVVADGLNGPRQIAPSSGLRLLVTESDIGQVTEIDPRRGTKTKVVSGFAPGAPQGAVRIGGQYVVITGEGPPGAGGSSVYVAKRGEKPKLLSNLMEYELAHNPDGQLQFDPETGEPLDALSNPFFVLEDERKHGFVLVADAGGNVVYAVDREGKVSEFFVPPVVTTGACEGLPNNDPEHAGCDPVPTGLAYGPNDTLYVSALTAEMPGEGRVYVLDAHTGKLKRTITGLSGPTGVAVDHRGTVYVSELLEGLPPEGPGPGTDPATIGQVVRIPWKGERSYAQVTMPTGLLHHRGQLYVSAWSVASFLGIPDAGQVVRLPDKAFVHDMT